MMPRSFLFGGSDSFLAAGRAEEEELARVGSPLSAEESGPMLRECANRSGPAAKFAAVTPAPRRNCRLFLFPIFQNSICASSSSVVSQKLIEEQPQILRLTTPSLKSTPGAPFAQDDSFFVGHDSFFVERISDSGH
jgi:hypothetical protein